MDKIQALHKFWSSFELKAYEENSVPELATMPYITYEVQSDSFDGNEIPLTASLWYRSTSWADITHKADEISKYIGMGGIFIHFDDGNLWIKRRTPFAQNMSDNADEIVKRKIISISIEYWTEN